jgi:hypothetical protein
MNRLVLIPIVALASSAAIACTTPTSSAEESTEASENAVRTARCSESIAMNVSSLEMRTFFAELSDPSDYNAMKSVAFEIGARQTIEFAGSLASKASGRCNYEGADGAKAVLYTKSGKDILRLSFTISNHEVFVYTYPKKWAPEIEYAADAPARFMTTISAQVDPPEEDVMLPPFFVTLGTGKARGGHDQGLVLPNGADITQDDRPDTLRVVVPKGNATAAVTDSSLASCEATKNTALSTSAKTVFDLSLEYEVDDGWNGCLFTFTATGYSSQLTAGFSIDD